MVSNPLASIDTAAVVGAGVIGAAWAARFALHGVDVLVSDPNPDTARNSRRGVRQRPKPPGLTLSCQLSTRGS